MALGIFKKKNYADTIYMNGHIFTQDPAFPWASAVACKDGRVLAVGDFDGMDEIISEDTITVDLDEKYMFPGFIDTHATPVLKAFEDKYLAIDPVWDLDTVLEAVEAYAEDCEEEVIFAYGYNEHILADYETPEEAHQLLDQIASERPLLILGTSGLHCWTNTFADDLIQNAAAEEGMQFVTPDYILDLLSPFDFEAVQKSVLEVSGDLADKGITSVFDLGAPDYFSRLYRDCLIAITTEENELQQRFFGSFYINRPLNPALILHTLETGRTDCTELGDMITYDFLKLEVSDDEEGAFFSQEALDTICMTACEKGFHLHLDALDRESFDKAVHTFAMLREKGCKTNTFVLASDYPAEEDANYLQVWPSDYLNKSVFGHCKSTAEAVDLLTIEAASQVSREKDMGSIEKGKLADFTVFEENPLDCTLDKFSKLHAEMTVIEGRIVYDANEEAIEEMYDLMLSMRV